MVLDGAQYKLAYQYETCVLFWHGSLDRFALWGCQIVFVISEMSWGMQESFTLAFRE